MLFSYNSRNGTGQEERMPVSLRIEILNYRTFTIRGFCGILGTLSRRGYGREVLQWKDADSP